MTYGPIELHYEELRSLLVISFSPLMILTNRMSMTIETIFKLAEIALIRGDKGVSFLIASRFIS